MNFSWAPDSKYFAGDGDGLVLVWRVGQPKPMFKPCGAAGYLHPSWLSDGRHLFIESWDSVKLWRISDGKLVRILNLLSYQDVILRKMVERANMVQAP